MTDPPDYNLKITVRNGRLLTRIREAGYETVMAFCKAHGLRYNSVGRLVGLKDTGQTNKSEWRKTVIIVSDILKCMPQDIIPPQHWHDPLKRNTFELPMTGDQAAELVGSNDLPDANLVREDLRKQIGLLMHDLAPRYERVLRLRYGIDCREHTLEEVGEMMDVGRERIRQMEMKALRVLRKPSRANKLKPYLNDPAVTNK